MLLDMPTSTQGVGGPWAGDGTALAPVPSAKHTAPAMPPATVRRAGLMQRLGTVGGPALVSIVAPAGYGKTTLLREWGDQLPGAAYVAVDGRDDDPVVLLMSIATALDRVQPVPGAVASLDASAGRSLAATLVPRLVEATWAHRAPTVLMLDDMDHLHGQTSLDVVAELMLHLPPNLRLALAARRRLPLPFARLDVTGDLLELDAHDLALDESAARAIAKAIGVPISSEQVASLLARTEGWPAATYLGLRAAASTRRDGRSEVEMQGTERSLADYMRLELLDPLDQDTRRWLLRSSVLDTMTGPLCDAALDTTGSLALLRQLEDQNSLIVPLDAHRRAYRYHHLFRDLLRDEIEVHEPSVAAEVRARAAAWFVEHDEPETAVEYAHASGDMDIVATLVMALVFPLHWSGRMVTLSRWLAWFDRDGERERRAPLAVLAGWIHALEGRTSEARRWLAVAEQSPDRGPMPDGSSKESWLALLRGSTAPTSLEQLRADARLGLAGTGDDSPFRQTALVLAGLADIAAGSLDTADEWMAAAVELSEARSATPGVALALGERALIAFARGDVTAASRHVNRGLRRVREAGMEDDVLAAVLHAVAARTNLAGGRASDAHAAIARVSRLRPRVMTNLPIPALQMRYETIRACITLGDSAAARALLLEVRDILRRFPDLGTLAHEAALVEREVESMGTGSVGPWTLTAAELRLLVYLPTHLSFREIADRLYVSPHTIKSQAMAVYGKLGVSSRRGAIERGVEAGLLDASAVWMPETSGSVG